MKKGTKITLISTAVLALGGGIYLLTRKFDKINKALKSSKGGGSSSGSSSTGYDIIANRPTNTGAGFPLQKGSRGNEVGMLQKFINLMIKFTPSVGLSPIAEDKIFGNQTENALKKLNLPTVIYKSTYDEYLDRYNRLSHNASGIPVKTKRIAHPDKLSASGRPVRTQTRNRLQNRIQDPARMMNRQQTRQQNNLMPNKKGKKPYISKLSEKERNRYRKELVDMLIQDLSSSDYKTEELYDALAALPDVDFIVVTKMFNRRNQNNGNLRTLQYEIRASSGIKNEEALLNRFDKFFDELNTD